MRTEVVASVEHNWWIIDAANEPVGRVAVQAAQLLLGKHKPNFGPGVVSGDHVVIVNAGKVALKGNKAEEPIHWHTQYPGGLRRITRGRMLEKNPTRLVERAVKGMLPHNRHGAELFRKLRVYAGAEHPHQAQSPSPRPATR